MCYETFTDNFNLCILAACAGAEGSSDGVEERSDGASRYPKRNLPKTDYSTIESPEEDDFICKSSYDY